MRTYYYNIKVNTSKDFEAEVLKGRPNGPVALSIGPKLMAELLMANTMRHKTDVTGLGDYLKRSSIIPKDSKVILV